MQCALIWSPGRPALPTSPSQGARPGARDAEVRGQGSEALRREGEPVRDPRADFWGADQSPWSPELQEATPGRGRDLGQWPGLGVHPGCPRSPPSPGGKTAS